MVGMSERVRHSLVVAVSPKFPIETGPAVTCSIMGRGHASPLNEFGACRSTHLDELPGGHREVLRREGELCRRHRVGRHRNQLWWPKWGGIWYFDIPSPNTTVSSVLWPPSIALWGSLVPPYTLVVR